MPNVGVWEILLVLLVALIVFGPKRLPEMGRSLGRGIREFRTSIATAMPTEEELDPNQPAATEQGAAAPTALPVPTVVETAAPAAPTAPAEAQTDEPGEPAAAADKTATG